MSIRSQKIFNKRINISYSVCQKTGALTNLYYEGSITLILKPENSIHHKKQKYRPKSLMNLDKNLQSNFSSSYPTVYKKSNIPQPRRIYFGYVRLFHYLKNRSL